MSRIQSKIINNLILKFQQDIDDLENINDLLKDKEECSELRSMSDYELVKMKKYNGILINMQMYKSMLTNSMDKLYSIVETIRQSGNNTIINETNNGIEKLNEQTMSALHAIDTVNQEIINDNLKINTNDITFDITTILKNNHDYYNYLNSRKFIEKMNQTNQQRYSGRVNPIMQTNGNIITHRPKKTSIRIHPTGDTTTTYRPRRFFPRFFNTNDTKRRQILPVFQSISEDIDTETTDNPYRSKNKKFLKYIIR
jgi:hypothetical protein